jgi:triacylglycerol esterase/lipase EstA (alpha/beta hydrolase family)
VSLGIGHATKLKLTPANKCEALGLIPVVYARLKLQLWWNGFDVDEHFYDWRHSLDSLGKELKDRVVKLASQGNKVHVVAHSMGGLVSRAAVGHGAPISRLIMLGTPNHGSLEPVQAIQ